MGHVVIAASLRSPTQCCHPITTTRAARKLRQGVSSMRSETRDNRENIMVTGLAGPEDGRYIESSLGGRWDLPGRWKNSENPMKAI